MDSALISLLFPSHPTESKHHEAGIFVCFFLFTTVSLGTVTVSDMEQMLTKYLLKRWLSSQHHILHSLTQPPKTHM